MLGNYLPLRPWVRFLSYIDDAGIGARDRDPRAAVARAVQPGKTLCDAAARLVAVFDDNFAIIPSSAAIGKGIAQQLHVDEKAAQRVLPYLGFDS